jgi:hypothetical protein
VLDELSLLLLGVGGGKIVLSISMAADLVTILRKTLEGLRRPFSQACACEYGRLHAVAIKEIYQPPDPTLGSVCAPGSCLGVG